MGEQTTQRWENYLEYLLATYPSLNSLSQEHQEKLKFAVSMAYLEGHLDATADAVRRINNAKIGE